MQVRRVLYCLALMMSVASVCVAADEAGGHVHSSSSSNSGGDDCPPPAEENARNTLNGPLNIPQYCANQRRSNAPPGVPLPIAAAPPSPIAPVASPAGSGNDGSANPPIAPIAAPPIADPPIAGAAAEGSDGSSPSGGPTGANVNTPAGEGAVNAESTATAQPTSPSPESSDTETANGSGTANDGGSSTPAGSEPSNNPSDADNTENTTTTTTTTIPTVPEISNSNIMPNVKGDADSSSSISSSVWMGTAAPLLIVVVLFSATMY